jgi:hypothetical protein
MDTVLEDLLNAAAKPPARAVDLEWVHARGRHLRRRRVGVTVLAAALVAAVVAGAPLLLASSDHTEVTVMGTPGSGDAVRLPVLGSNRVVGYADRDALASKPVVPRGATPTEEAAAVARWKHTLVPVTKTRDPDSALVGYVVHTVGFIDLATFTAPDFDLDALLAQHQGETDLTGQEP